MFKRKRNKRKRVKNGKSSEYQRYFKGNSYIFSIFDNEMIEKIPGYVISKLCKEAADSKLNFYINPNKKFEEQELSEKSKDLIISFLCFRKKKA